MKRMWILKMIVLPFVVHHHSKPAFPFPVVNVIVKDVVDCSFLVMYDFV